MLHKHRLVNRPSNSVKHKTTLIVAPPAILDQWCSEIKKFAPHVFTIYLYHGNKRIKKIAHLNQYDIIITSYSTLSSDVNNNKELGPLLQMTFFRIVLDEAHSIKNAQSKCAKVCLQLQSKYRWCLTGTPIQNKVDDLFPLFTFTNIVANYNEFQMRFGVGRNCKTIKGSSLKKLQVLLGAHMLRRFVYKCFFFFC